MLKKGSVSRRVVRGIAGTLTMLLVMALSACAANPRSDAPDREPTTVRVDNRAWTEMTLYAVASGQRVRLGTVGGTSTAVLRIPPGVVGQGRNLTFLADPLGSSRTSTSFEIFVRPGEQVTLTIPPGAG